MDALICGQGRRSQHAGSTFATPCGRQEARELCPAEDRLTGKPVTESNLTPMRPRTSPLFGMTGPAWRRGARSVKIRMIGAITRSLMVDMPMSERCIFVYSCAPLNIAADCGNLQFRLVGATAGVHIPADSACWPRRWVARVTAHRFALLGPDIRRADEEWTGRCIAASHRLVGARRGILLRIRGMGEAGVYRLMQADREPVYRPEGERPVLVGGP